ncbi:hypothetical protein ABPG72_011742 [Tetrahymena utriculariae]
MENFSKKRFSNLQKQSTTNETDDYYLQDIQKRLESKQTGGIMKQSLDRFYTDDVEDFELKHKLASNRVKSLFYLYLSLFGAVINTSIIYYPSIKFVKKVFRLKGFWNVHFAALPLIMTWNATTLGLAVGIYQSVQQQRFIDEQKKKSTYKFWNI